MMPRKKHYERSRLTEQQLRALDEVFTGFAAWYRANCDETGKYVGKAWDMRETVRETEKTEQETG